MKADYESLAANVLRSRLAQQIINERIKGGEFKIPIHLAFGHEAIAEAISSAMCKQDKLLCTHRNIHYQFARGATFLEIINEFKLTEKGLARGLGGSMNLTNPNGSIIYTSSILGNNLCVALGIALSKKIRGEDGIAIAITGDGAIEEGAFYESVENARSMDLPLMIVVENNSWSLASRIEERRKSINLGQLASSLGARYTYLENNNLELYCNQISLIRNRILADKIPEVLEVGVITLGGWMLSRDGIPDRYVNYHAGSAPKISLKSGLILNFDESDPVFVIQKKVGKDRFEYLVRSISHEFLSDIII